MARKNGFHKNTRTAYMMGDKFYQIYWFETIQRHNVPLEQCKYCIKYYPPTLDYIITILLYVIQYYYIYLTPTLLCDFWK